MGTSRLRGFVIYIIALISSVASNAQSARTPLSAQTALYPRAIRLARGSGMGQVVASVFASPATGPEEDVYTSIDGDNFRQVGTIKDPSFANGLCCGTIFELPQALGALRAGTLLWSGSSSFDSKSGMFLKVFASRDEGRTWTYLSECAHSNKPWKPSGGLWEPAFLIAKDGALVCMYSDETQPGHSQILREVRSYDGVHWQDPSPLVSSPQQPDRPGMAVASKLPDGRYFLSYEVCGPPACAVFTRTSSDGWNWGDSTTLGTKVVAEDGSTLQHAPTNAFLQTGERGALLLIGQITLDASGKVSPRNGQTIFVSRDGSPEGMWSVIASPIAVPGAYDNSCPNYSSSLLPSADGKSLLELASDFVGKTCLMFHAQAPLQSLTR